MPTETERKVLEAVKELGKARPYALSRKLGYTSGYMAYLCDYLERNGLLVREGGYYKLKS